MDDDSNIFKVVEGDSNVPNGYAPLRAFGERNAGNFNTYCKKDEVSGIYVFYRTENSMKNEAPESDESESETKKSESGYLGSLFVATASNESKAKAKITKQTTKYYIYDHNLSPNAGYATYIGYTITMDEKKAITDIRIAPYNGNNSVNFGDIQYIYGGTVGVDTGSGDSTASSQNDAILYTCDEKAGSPSGVDSLHIVNAPDDAEDGWEPIMPFCSGLPYDFNVTHVTNGEIGEVSGYLLSGYEQGGNNYDLTKYWDTHKEVYLYFEPSVKYTGGEKYLSGVYFISGFDAYYLTHISTGKKGSVTKTSDDVKSSFSALKDEVKNNRYSTLCDTNLAQSVSKRTCTGSSNLQTYIGYTYTYNPKRALYDLVLFQGTPYSSGLPYTVSKLQENKSVINYVASTVYVQQGFENGNIYRGISYLNSYMNNTGNILDSRHNTYIGTEENYVKKNSNIVEYGTSKLAVPTVGLYASGYVSGKEPLRMRDVIINDIGVSNVVKNSEAYIYMTNKRTIAGTNESGAFHGIFNIENPNDQNAFNLAYPTYY